jgi:DNA-binding MarR family transcriptional regulator
MLKLKILTYLYRNPEVNAVDIADAIGEDKTEWR